MRALEVERGRIGISRLGGQAGREQIEPVIAWRAVDRLGDLRLSLLDLPAPLVDQGQLRVGLSGPWLNRRGVLRGIGRSGEVAAVERVAACLEPAIGQQQ